MNDQKWAAQIIKKLWNSENTKNVAEKIALLNAYGQELYHTGFDDGYKTRMKEENTKQKSSRSSVD